MSVAISEYLNKSVYEIVCEKNSDRYWYSKMQWPQLDELYMAKLWF